MPYERRLWKYCVLLLVLFDLTDKIAFHLLENYKFAKLHELTVCVDVCVSLGDRVRGESVGVYVCVYLCAYGGVCAHASSAARARVCVCVCVCPCVTY